jgi:serine protease AprX
MARRLFACLVMLAALAEPALAAAHRADGKLDAALRVRAHAGRGTSRVILRTVDGRPADRLVGAVGGRVGRRFGWMGGLVADIPDSALEWLAGQPEVASISLDRAVRGTMERTATAIGARWVSQQLGVDGSGIGVATIDSGVSIWHDDLAERVIHFADFVNFEASQYDDYGHGTHVAGIISGSGQDSAGARRGIAPGAHLIVLKALDATGNGYTSTVIAAIDYAIAHRETYNIRVINLSVVAGVYESFTKDPLALAAKRAVDAGIVVVAAAGNLGRGFAGRPQHGSIAAPGNAPWVLTVGAANHMGTAGRADDIVAAFSSRGPAVIDQTAKPDLVAPGVAIESTTDPGSALFAAHPFSRLRGTVNTALEPYLALTGTSMSAPVVAGTIALVLQANPRLTPNAVKAVLEFTAEHRASFDTLTQGAGFLNARGAVDLARALAGQAPVAGLPADPVTWSRHIIWGNHRVGGGTIGARANAWMLGVTWGDAQTSDGHRIAWGTACKDVTSECNEPWVVPCDPASPGCEPASNATRTEDVVATFIESDAFTMAPLDIPLEITDIGPGLASAAGTDDESRARRCPWAWAVNRFACEAAR